MAAAPTTTKPGAQNPGIAPQRTNRPGPACCGPGRWALETSISKTPLGVLLLDALDGLVGHHLLDCLLYTSDAADE